MIHRNTTMSNVHITCVQDFSFGFELNCDAISGKKMWDKVYSESRIYALVTRS